jgi:UDP-glucuronate 4-epimerase
MKILVTGGAGFIGSNLISVLLRNKNHQIICFDNFDNDYAQEQKQFNINPFLENKNFNLVEGDIRNQNDLDKIPSVDVIVHLAAKTDVRSSFKNASLFYDVNVTGTLNLLEFARYWQVKQFIFASSSSIYGINPNTPWREDEEGIPISPYASSKLICEKLGHFYSTHYNIRFIALRLFNVYGPAQRPNLVIYRFFKSILSEEPLTVFGNGSSSRDYSFVEDITQGILAAISYNQSDFEVINLGGQHTIKMYDLIKGIETISKRKAIIKYYPEQDGDLSITYASIVKAQKILKYNPGKQFEIGLSEFYIWYTSAKNYKK